MTQNNKMIIDIHKITIRDLVDGYEDLEEDGVVGYHGDLDIRPPYQREFVYKGKQKYAVIDTVMKGYPLNVMYWYVKSDGKYEVLDGQQRTISICQFYQGDFSIKKGNKDYYFENLPKDEQEQFLNYELMVYFCSDGTDSEKLDWFSTINIAGEELSAQELRNAVYTGRWLFNAKHYFSKRACLALKHGEGYVKTNYVRQELLEMALKWIAAKQKTSIENYMAKHQFDPNASELWQYYTHVMIWVSTVFNVKREEMMGLPWGELYNEFGENQYDAEKLEIQVSDLMANEEIQNKKGIYQYILTGKEKYLNLRTFDKSIMRTRYEQQQGICPHCQLPYKFSEMEGDHIIPWTKGGKTTLENCQMLCAECNRKKGAK